MKLVMAGLGSGELQWRMSDSKKPGDKSLCTMLQYKYVPVYVSKCPVFMAIGPEIWVLKMPNRIHPA